MSVPGGWKGRLRRLLLRLLFWGGAVLALVFFCLVLYLRSDMAREHLRVYLQTELSARLQRPVTLGAVDFTVLPTMFEAEDVTLAGPTADEPPVLTIERLRLRSQLERLWRRDWSLDRVELQRPVLRLSLAEDGSLNLPSWSSGGGGDQLKLAALVVREGRFEFDQLRLDLDFAAETFRLNLLRQAPGELQGQLQTGTLQLNLPGANQPLPVSMTTDLRLSRELLEVSSLRLHLKEGADASTGSAEQLSGPWTAVGRGRFEVRTGDGLLALTTRGNADLLAQLGWFDGIAGPLTTEGAVFHRRGEGWSYRGRADSPNLHLAGWQLAQAAGELQVTAGTLHIDVVDGRYAGGRVAGQVELRFDLPGDPLEIDLTVADMRLARFLELRQLPITGVDASVQGRLILNSVSGRREYVDGSGQFFLQPIESAVSGTSPLQLLGSVPFVLDAGIARLEGVSLSSEQQRLSGSGSFDTLRSAINFDFRLSTDSVAELLPVFAPLWDGSGDDAGPPSWFPRTGRGVVDGRLWLAPDGVQLDGVRPLEESVLASDLRDRVGLGKVGQQHFGQQHLQQLDLDLDLEDVSAPDLDAEQLTGTVRLSRWAIERLFLQLREQDGALQAEGWAALDLPEEMKAAERMQLTFDAVDWPLARVGYWRQLDIPLDGALTGRLTLQGPYDDLVGRLEARSGAATAFGQPLRAVRAALEWNQQRLRFDRLDLTATAGTARTTGELQFADGALDLQVDTDVLRLETPPLNLLFGDRLQGGLSFSGRIGGRLDAPALRGRIETRELSVLGHRVVGESVAGESVAGESAAGQSAAGQGGGEPNASWVAEIDWDGERFDAHGDLGLLRLDGGGRLDPRGADLRFDLQSQQLARLVELLSGMPAPKLQGHLAGELRVHQDVADGAAAPPVFELRLHEVEGEYRRLRFAAEEPLELTARGSEVEVRSVFLRESVDEDEGPTRPGELRMSGTLQLREGLPVDLDVQSKLSTRWLRLFTPELDLPGQFELQARLHGPAGSPRVEGTGRLRLDDFVWPLSPQTVEGLRAEFTLTDNAVALDTLSAEIGGGTLAMRGEVQLGRGTAGSGVDYEFTAQATDVKLLYPEGWQQQGDASLRLVKTPQGRQVEGTVRLAEMRFQESLGLSMAEAARQLVVPQRIEIVRTENWLTSTALNIDIQGPEALRVRNQEADLRGDVELTLGGDLARPVLTGKVELEPGGTVAYAGNDYQVERGLLTFADPQRLEPTIDLLARARVRQYRVALNVSGTFDRLDARVSSDPPLPDLDVIRLITSGRAQEQELDAETLLYGQATSAVTERVSSLFGFDTLRIDPLLQGSDAVSTVRVTVGKRLSKDWFLTYSRDPSTTEEDILEAEWQVTPEMTLVFTQNGDGSFSVDARWESRF